ncbi:Formyltransferase/hydrolase complex Fhc subunit C [Pseudodesulfovibrio hydrargyri]|jgi:formylmethanofuran dehydrogenase subunit C|uniref:Formyltransferase/hydrolase complex Fhc subunit C n=1 Tax=Pseudodesulfovibrio hydrargyri TaxID=2125990 RepID=A0A1J5N0T3_9BACT|nr:formylmethanofuran dehydrogenase subunit C [Pseudodesulfovibrio hydrargyri]OIQ52413.1 Formyltransferase/hydrolase complex Fhc subunit C [Pseudodesulfovibrio hydrargyri]
MNTRVYLTLRTAPAMPVEAESLLPENVTGKSAEEIESLPLQVGNRTEPVGDHFRVEIHEGRSGGPDEGAAALELTGDLTRFKRLGEGMSRGSLTVNGTVGFHAGARMSGGTLTINGNAGDYLGAMMTGGRITVHGNAGHFAGSAYRGFFRGMSGGSILVLGNAGNLTGARMRRGMIAVRGTCGDLAGYAMGAGTVLIGGRAGVRAGANMVRGTVILLTPPEEMPPTFRYDYTGLPPFWPLMHASLSEAGWTAPEAEARAEFKRYSGDFNEGGRGELLLLSGAA